MCRRFHPVACIAAAVLASLFSGAGASDHGQQYLHRILINDVRINDDAGTAMQLSPVLAMHKHGPLVIAWPDGRNGGWDIYFQRLGRRGSLDGANTRVNDASLSGSFMDCDAAVDGEGHFIIAFSGGSAGQSHVYAQWYMANGKPLGGNVFVDEGPDDKISNSAAVASCDLGTSVVAWVDYRHDAKGNIWFQRFERDGTARGGIAGVASRPDSAEINPAVGMDSRGNFVMVWQQGTVRPKVMARLILASGGAIGPAFQVSPLAGDGIDRTANPTLAVLPNGRFVVFWMAIDDGGNVLRQARMFDADGDALSTVFRVDEAGKFDYTGDLSVAAYPGGGLFAFAWAGNESGDWNIYSRFSNASGVFAGSSAAVNDRPGMQIGSEVAMDAVGNTVYAWQDNRNANFDVYATGIAPKKPNYVTAGSGYDGMVPLTWEPWYLQGVRTQYRILRKESLSATPTVIATVDPNTRPYPDRMLDYIDNTAENGHTYYYGVENVAAGSAGPTYVTASPSASGHVIRSAWSEVDPSLDGVLSPGEWDDAVKVRLTNPDALHGAWLYVKNTGGVLYAAVDDSNDMTLEAATSFGMFFDLDHNGKWDVASPSHEGGIAVTNAGAVFQGYRGVYPAGFGMDAAQAAAGIQRSFSAASGHVQYEVAIDLAASPVKAAAGATIGAGFRVWDPGNFYGYHYANAGEWPEGSLWEAAETLGNLVLATEGEVTPGVYTVTNTQDSGPGSLRQAIEDANAGEVSCRIQFQIPVTDSGYNATVGTWTIRPASVLPGLFTRGTLLDGTSQAAYTGTDTNPLGPEIMLDGSETMSISGLSMWSSRSEIRHLMISGFKVYQIEIRCDSCTVAGCYIGTDELGLHNTLTGGGIQIEGNGSTIGGSSDSDRNIISGLKGSAIDMAGSSENRVLGNFIGINAAGTDTLGNFWGVRIMDESRRNTVGPGNVISANLDNGIWINNHSDSNTVIGNRIGTDPLGERNWGNGGEGISIVTGCSNNFIGGSSEVERNIVSGNGSAGIRLYGAGTDSNLVIGNFIGTSADGSAAIPNEWTGILISDGASRNRIGGQNPGEGNLISGNLSCGIWMQNTGTDGNEIVGNLIGTDAGGTLPLGNERDGIQISTGPCNNRIGPGNLIAFNGDAGISIRDAGTDGNRITQNRIHDNDEMGIDLSGGNEGVPTPEIEQASPLTGSTMPNAEVELFSGPDDEGMNYLATVTADGSGIFDWPGTPAGRYVTVTATDAEGNTSEFSSALETGTGVESERFVPKEFSLEQNHPNPFNPSTEIRFDVKEPSRVVLKVLDLRGREVATVADGKYGEGRHTVRFDASNLPSGIYLYRIQMGNYTASRKMVLSR